jgi:hypothetical protein
MTGLLLPETTHAPECRNDLCQAASIAKALRYAYPRDHVTYDSIAGCGERSLRRGHACQVH